MNFRSRCVRVASPGRRSPGCLVAVRVLYRFSPSEVLFHHHRGKRKWHRYCRSSSSCSMLCLCHDARIDTSFKYLQQHHHLASADTVQYVELLNPEARGKGKIAQTQHATRRMVAKERRSCTAPQMTCYAPQQSVSAGCRRFMIECQSHGWTLLTWGLSTVRITPHHFHSLLLLAHTRARDRRSAVDIPARCIASHDRVQPVCHPMPRYGVRWHEKPNDGHEAWIRTFAHTKSM